MAANNADSTTSDPCRLANTHASQAAAMSIGKAMSCLNLTIHGPGRGKRTRSPGHDANTR